MMSLSKFLVRGLNTYARLTYIQNIVRNGILSSDSVGRETEYDALLERMEEIYQLKNSEQSISRLKSFLSRYESKVLSEYERKRKKAQAESARAGVRPLETGEAVEEVFLEMSPSGVSS